MNKQEIYAMLDAKGIRYEAAEHGAARTIGEMDALAVPHKEWIVKNLFLRDDKRRNYYLVTLPGHKTAGLKSLAGKIPSRKLSFANEEALRKLLGLAPGHVTPLAALGDGAKNVTVVFDRSLEGRTVGVHPMENTATVFLAFEDLRRLVAEHGNPVVLCDVGADAPA